MKASKIELPADAALVLFEWLEEREQRDWEGVQVTHRGELAALSQLGGELERTLVATFDPRYRNLLSDARDRLAAAYPPYES